MTVFSCLILTQRSVYLFIFVREWERERENQYNWRGAEGVTDFSLRRDPNVRFYPRTQGSWTEPKSDTQLTEPPSCPMKIYFYLNFSLYTFLIFIFLKFLRYSRYKPFIRYNFQILSPVLFLPGLFCEGLMYLTFMKFGLSICLFMNHAFVISKKSLPILRWQKFSSTFF